MVDKFREPGRSLLMPPHGVRLEPDTVIDISHESLMRIWTRLKLWLDEESKAAEMYLKLSESAFRYQLGTAGLWKMPDLQLALNWKEENKPTLIWGQRYDPAFERTMVFLETSKKAHETEQRNKEVLQKRALRRSRLTTIILAFFTLVALFFMIYSFVKQNEAEKQKVSALKAQKQAKEEADKANRLAELAEEAEASALKQQRLAQEAAEKAEIEAEAARIASVRASKAEKDARIEAANAREQKALADEERSKAQKSAKEAKAAEARALDAKTAADQLRYQAIAQSMAIRSRQIRNNPRQQALIAKQAYMFFTEFGGSEMNGDLYSGVFYALKELKGDSLNHFRNGHTGMVRSMVFNGSGSALFSAGSDGQILKWDLAKNKSHDPELVADQEEIVRVIDVSKDNRWLVTGSNEDQMSIIDLNSNDKASSTPISGHQGAVYDLVFLGNDNRFASCGEDKKVLISTMKGDTTYLETDGYKFKTLAAGNRKNLLAGGSQSGEVMLWNLTSSTKKMLLKERNNTIHSLAFGGDDDILAIGDEYGNIILWDLELDKEIRALSGHTARVTQIAFSPNGKIMATASLDRTARLWFLDDLNELPITLDDHGDWVYSLAFHPDGKTLYTGSKDHIIRSWPIIAKDMADEICDYIESNLSDFEWSQYVGEDIEYRHTCVGLPKAK